MDRPQSARLIDRYGQTRVLPLLVTAHGLAIAGLLAGGPMLPLAVPAGATIPQAGAFVAARWSHALAGSELLSTAFALESMASSVALRPPGAGGNGGDPRRPARRTGAGRRAGGGRVGPGTALRARPRRDGAACRGRMSEAGCARRVAGARRAAPRAPRRARFFAARRANAGLGMVFGRCRCWSPHSPPITAPRGSPGRSTAS